MCYDENDSDSAAGSDRMTFVLQPTALFSKYNEIRPDSEHISVTDKH